mgnify:CR=1 FL=1
MRVCWNWQTGTFEGRVSNGVWVQVPSLAPKQDNPKHIVIIGERFGFIVLYDEFIAKDISI